MGDTGRNVTRLRALREELEKIDPRLWAEVQEWASKARPVVRLGWPEFYEEFLEHLTPPVYPQSPRVAGNRFGPEDNSLNQRLDAQDRAVYESRAGTAKRMLLNFVDALLAASSDAGADERADQLEDFGLLFRRSEYDRDAVAMVEEAERAGEPLVAMMIDLDHFKQVNDTHGHDKGDEVLKAVFGIVKVRVKSKGKAYRYGGDEIAVLLPNYTAAEGTALAEVIRGNIERSDVVRELGVTVSIGVACLPDHATDAANLLKSADAAMYRAKGSGKNQVASA